jgi:hypothetical protein
MVSVTVPVIVEAEDAAAGAAGAATAAGAFALAGVAVSSLLVLLQAIVMRAIATVRSSLFTFSPFVFMW